jgi:hypothetical protein
MQPGGFPRVIEIKGWKHAEKDLAVGGAMQVQTHAMPPPPATPEPSPNMPRWPKSRVAAVEALWGDGFSSPGGGPEALRLVKPMALSNSVTLLLLGGGLGGPAMAISGSMGAWVASFEADEELRAIAAARLPKPDSGSPKITVSAWDPSQPAFRARSANHALLLEAMRGTQPAPVLEKLAAALSANGQIVLTELVADEPPSEKDREFAAWCRLDNRRPHMPRAAEVTGALQKLGFDVRVAEDMSDRHITQTLEGWREAVKAMAAGPRPTPQSAAAFVSEAELWLLRIRLMRRLGVRLMRWHAIRHG